VLEKVDVVLELRRLRRLLRLLRPPRCSLELLRKSRILALGMHDGRREQVPVVLLSTVLLRVPLRLLLLLLQAVVQLKALPPLRLELLTQPRRAVNPALPVRFLVARVVHSFLLVSAHARLESLQHASSLVREFVRIRAPYVVNGVEHLRVQLVNCVFLLLELRHGGEAV